MKSGRRLITIVVAAVAVLVLVLSMLNLVPSTEPANSAGPPYPDPGANVKATDQQGGYLTDGTLSWEAVAPNPTTGALDHIAGVTFILVGTQANWDGSSAQAGSQMTIVDCVAPSPCTGSGDQDDRAGYFRISRSSGLEAQEFMYRVWEVTAPAGYNAMYPVNSYSYDTPAQPGVVRSDNLYFYPNYSWQPGQPVNGWYFGQFMNYPLPVQISWSKTNADTGAKITGALFNLYKGNQVLAYSNVADCVNEPCAGPDSNPSLGDYTVSGITAVDFGNWQVLEVQAPAGYDLPNPNQAKSVNLSEWNTKPDLGAFPNAPTPPPPPADPIPDLTFTKVDAANLNTFLPHSEWKLDFSTGSDIDKLLDCAGSSENDCRNQYAPAEYGFDLDPDVGEFRVELATTHIGDTAVMYEITPPPGYAINPAFAESSGSDLGTIICADADDPSCHKDLGKITNSAVYPTLMWAKTDTNGNALADSTWSLAEQNKWDTTATYIVDYTGQTSYQCNSTVVPDNNILCDLDARPGYFRIHDILLQGPNKVFELREKTAPAGYQAINTTFTSDPLSEPTCTYQFCTLTDGKCDTAADGTYSAIFNQIIKPTLAWHIVNTFTPADDLLGTVWSLSMVGSTSVTRSISDWTGEPGYTGLDRDPRASHFLIAGVSPGTWRLGESVCPVGYDCIEPQYIKPVTVGPEQAGVFTDDYPDSNVHNSYIPPIVDWTKTDSQRQPLGDSVWAFCPIYDNHPQGDCDESLVGEFAHILDLTDTAYGHGDHNPAKGAVDIWSGFFWDDGNIYADRGALHEVSAPFGYICDKTIQPYSQTCASGGLALATATVGPGTYVNLGAFQNDQFPEITWTKVYNDGSSNIPLGGATFELTDTTTPTSNSYTVADCTTSGKCTAVLGYDQDPRAGYFDVFVSASDDTDHEWKLTETNAPPGFEAAAPPTTKDAKTNSTTDFGSVVNTVKKPVVNFRKVDAQTPVQQPLAGAVF
ncbi:MAG: prealbumin-like fold domain-containing protein, partial [Bifidobacteriaceae bacterium]|nr:prealbumin-like fold domain-containing protein [Bifidobacteriaceae bacterium]